MTVTGERERAQLLRRGFALEYVTLGWNVIGIVVLAFAAVAARSVALAGFGLDSLIEIGASTVVIWELSGTGEARQRKALRMIGAAFAALAAYLLVQSTLVLAVGYRPGHSAAGIVWTAVTAAVMFALAAGKAATGRALGNPVLCTEGRVTAIDGVLAAAVLAGLALNATLGWWQADPAAGYVLVYYAVRETRDIFSPSRLPRGAATSWAPRSAGPYPDGYTIVLTGRQIIAGRSSQADHRRQITRKASHVVLITRSILLFVLAAVFEIGGAWLVWQGLRDHRGWLWVLAGAAALGGYGLVATLQPSGNFGRILAAYGAIFIAGSLAWGWVADGYRPDRYDLLGAAICLAGMAVIMYAPRQH